MGQIMGKLRKNHGWNVADSWVFQSDFSSIVSNALKNSWVGIIGKFSSRKEWSSHTHDPQASKVFMRVNTRRGEKEKEKVFISFSGFTITS